MKKVISMIVTVFIVMAACSAWMLAEDIELLELDNNRIYPVTNASAENPRFQPKLIMSGYTVTPGIVKAGDEFEISVTIRNTSQEFEARNITVRYGGNGIDILPVDDKNIQYINLIKSGGSIELTFRMVSRLESTTGIQKITLTMDYEDSKANAFSMNDEIFFQITHPIRIESDEFEIPDTVNAGDSLSLNFNIFNKGRGKAYNVMCKITGKGILAESSVFIGTMEPGSTGRAEIYAFVGTLDMSADDGKSTDSSQSTSGKYGLTSGVITITYEDEFGKEFGQKIKFDITIIPPVTKTSISEETTEKVDKVSQWWVSVLIAGLIIAGLIAWVIINRRRNAKAYRNDGMDS